MDKENSYFQKKITVTSSRLFKKVRLKSYPKGIIFLLIFVSCSQKVIRRDHAGMRVSNRASRFLNTLKKKVVLLPFFSEASYGGQDLAIVATEDVRRELLRTREFTIDPLSVQTFGTSKQVYAGGGTKLLQLSKKAKRSGINYVILGRVVNVRLREKSDEVGIMRKTRTYASAKLEVRIFEINSNKEVFMRVVEGNADDKTYRFFSTNDEKKLMYRQTLMRYAIKIAIRKLIPRIKKLAARLKWSGRVAKIIGAKIYLNAGRQSGLHIGDILKVRTEGKEIYDPETGALIGITKGEVKGTLEVIDYFGADGTVAKLHSGGSVSESDVVHLY